ASRATRPPRPAPARVAAECLSSVRRDVCMTSSLGGRLSAALRLVGPAAVFCAARTVSTRRLHRLLFLRRFARPLALCAVVRAVGRALAAAWLAVAAATSASVLSSRPAQYSHARS